VTPRNDPNVGGTELLGALQWVRYRRAPVSRVASDNPQILDSAIDNLLPRTPYQQEWARPWCHWWLLAQESRRNRASGPCVRFESDIGVSRNHTPSSPDRAHIFGNSYRLPPSPLSNPDSCFYLFYIISTKINGRLPVARPVHPCNYITIGCRNSPIHRDGFIA